jgi:hypothetical protein
MQMRSPKHPSSHKSSQWGLQPALPWTAILGLCLMTVSLAVLGGGGILNLAFPAGALAVGVMLYFRAPVLYVGFSWWLWFLTPLVRRLADYRSGFTDPSPILLAPILVTSIAIITLVRYLPQSYKQGGLPFILCLLGVFYSFAIGLIQNPIVPTILDLLDWLTPIFFGFHLFTQWRSYPLYRQNLQRVFLWGVLIMGTYGILQYLVAPQWDRFWLDKIPVVSFGTPEPLKIRVWSTMNSPQSFAGTIVPGLLLLFSSTKNLRFPASIAGYLALLLSLARSAWLGGLAGLLVLIPFLKARLQLHILIGLVVGALLIIPLTTIEPFSTAISSRLETLSNVQADHSYQTRVSGYQNVIGLALVEYFGKGMGNTMSIGMGSNDSGILKLLFSMGYLGTFLYLSGLLLLVINLFQRTSRQSDSFVSVSRAVAIGTLSQIGLNVVTIAPIGIAMWGFVAMGLAAQKYDREQHMQSDLESLSPDLYGKLTRELR